MLQQNFEIIKEFDEEQIVALCQSDKKIYPAKFRLCFPTDVSECAKLFERGRIERTFEKMLFEPGNYNFNSRLNFGDKSITHRAFICGALAEGTTEIENACICRDTLSTADCLKKNGGGFCLSRNVRYRIPAQSSSLPKRASCAGLRKQRHDGAAACGRRRGAWNKSGVQRETLPLSRRPMDRVILPLREMGFDIRKTDNALFVTGDSTCVRDERELSLKPHPRRSRARCCLPRLYRAEQ